MLKCDDLHLRIAAGYQTVTCSLGILQWGTLRRLCTAHGARRSLAGASVRADPDPCERRVPAAVRDGNNWSNDMFAGDRVSLGTGSIVLVTVALVLENPIQCPICFDGTRYPNG